MEQIKEFSVTITQEHIDKAVALSHGGNICQICIVYQAVAEALPEANVAVGLVSADINGEYYYPTDGAALQGYTNLSRDLWPTAIPGKTIRFVLSEE